MGSSDETPIQAAINNSSTRCVKEIIQMHPKQLHTQVRFLPLCIEEMFEKKHFLDLY
jgi:hypothetical protein